MPNTYQQLKPALAASLFKDQVISLGAAAKVSGLNLSDFIAHLTALDIDIVVPDAHTITEMATVDTWLSALSVTAITFIFTTGIN